MNSYEFKVVCDYELLLGFYPPVNVYIDVGNPPWM